ncbi:MAG: protein-disulfide reductase DsbD family protein [Rhodospirillaceae bacterium]
MIRPQRPRMVLFAALWTVMAMFGLALSLHAAPALAQNSLLPEPGASAWVERPHGKVRLVSASLATGQTEDLRLGLEFDLAEEWKIYWRAPGDAGYPPDIDWSGSVNFAAGEILWPVPERFSILGLESVGYKDHVILPLSLQPAKAGDPVILSAKVDYLVCSDICVPDQVDLSMILPPGPGTPSDFSHQISQWESKVPRVGQSHGLAISAAELGPEDQIAVSITADPAVSQADLFVETPPGYAFTPPQVTLSDDGRTAHLSVTRLGERAMPDDATLSVLVTAGDRAVETPLVRVAALSAPIAPLTGTLASANPGPTDLVSLAPMLLFALLGGLILNLMPCVLPVLSLKVLGVLGHGGGSKQPVRRAFLASAAGILFSFLLLAGGAIALKLTGNAVGWGIQFQQPLFLGGLMAIILLFAANLWGLFEIPLPGFASALGGTVGSGTVSGGAASGSPGSEETEKAPLLGHFATGAFATLLATPCSAPFLGTALGFALSRGPIEILAIFTALGLGMALPYLAFVAFPGWATKLPRPGPWMITLKKVLALALVGTGVWLGSILFTQLSADPNAAARATGPSAGEAIAWTPFSPQALADALADNKIVFVDVTADWCITCKVNKAAVLDRGPALERLQGEDIVALRADWTLPDDGIAAYLASFGRYGIPFNAVYGANAPEGLPLPELLSSEDVLAAIEQAAL